MPTAIFAIIFYFAPEAAKPINIEQGPRLIGSIALTTILLPIISLLTLRFTSSISSFWLEDRKERVLPFFIMAVYYGATAYLLISRIPVNDFFTVILITMTLMVVVISLITIYWKISVHSTALCGLVGFILGLILKVPSAELLYPLIASILLAGTVMSARLALNAHTPGQIMGGSLVGFFMGAGSILIFT